MAHLGEAKSRIEEALDAQFIRNLGDINLRVAPQRVFGQPAGQPTPAP